MRRIETCYAVHTLALTLPRDLDVSCRCTFDCMCIRRDNCWTDEETARNSKRLAVRVLRGE